MLECQKTHSHPLPLLTASLNTLLTQLNQSSLFYTYALGGNYLNEEFCEVYTVPEVNSTLQLREFRNSALLIKRIILFGVLCNLAELYAQTATLR